MTYSNNDQQLAKSDWDLIKPDNNEKTSSTEGINLIIIDRN
jgi:hypothetical protein